MFMSFMNGCTLLLKDSFMTPSLVLEMASELGLCLLLFLKAFGKGNDITLLIFLKDLEYAAKILE